VEDGAEAIDVVMGIERATPAADDFRAVVVLDSRTIATPASDGRIGAARRGGS
jgi:hypothetical protein